MIILNVIDKEQKNKLKKYLLIELLMFLIVLIGILYSFSRANAVIDETDTGKQLVRSYYIKSLGGVVGVLLLPNIFFSLKQICGMIADLISGSLIDMEVVLGGGVVKYFSFFHHTLHEAPVLNLTGVKVNSKRRIFVIFDEKKNQDIIKEIDLNHNVEHPKTYRIVAGKYSHVVFSIERIKKWNSKTRR